MVRGSGKDCYTYVMSHNTIHYSTAVGPKGFYIHCSLGMKLCTELAFLPCIPPALNPGFLFWILIFLWNCEIKSRMEMDPKLTVYLPPSLLLWVYTTNPTPLLCAKFYPLSPPLWDCITFLSLPVLPYETVWHSSPSQSSPMSGCTWRTFPVLRCTRRVTCTEMSSHTSHAQSEEVASRYHNKTWHVQTLVPSLAVQ